MTRVEAPALRMFTIVVLSVATVGMLVLSMLTNATFGFRFGSTTVTAYVFAAANVIADLWKALGLIVVAGLLRQRQRAIAGLLSMLWSVALIFGVASSMGLYVQDRTAVIGGRETQSAALRNVEQELVEEESKLHALGTAGDANQIEAAIEAVFAKPIVVGERLRGTVGSISARCSKMDVRTVQECHQIAALRADLADAAEKTRREERIAKLRQQLRELRERGAGDAPDPVAELFAWMSRGLLSVRDVGFGFPVAFSLLIEMVSAFGPLGVATYAAVTRPSARAHDTAPPATPASLTHRLVQIEHQSSGSVVDFVAEETAPSSESRATGCDDLYDAYQRWCERKGSRRHQQDVFIAEFDRLRELPALRGKIRKFGTRYFGIALVAAKEAGGARGGA